MRLDSDKRSQSRSPQHSMSNGSNGFSPTLSKITNGHSAHGNSQPNGSTSPRESNGLAVTSNMSKSWLDHDREEVTRILIQGLIDLGYHNAAKMLSRESGFELEGPTVAAFRHAVLSGDWAEAEALLFGPGSYDAGGGVGIADGGGKSIDTTLSEAWNYHRGLTLSEGANKQRMLFCLREQKYLELLEKREIGPALVVLRQELTPLGYDPVRVHALSSYMMCQSAEDFKSQAKWDGANGHSRSQLLSELSRSISPSVMIPEHRLAELLREVKDGWIQNCSFHNTAESPSLYVDHMCTSEDFPTTCSRIFADHTDEVWYLAFSNDGSKLATASKDQTVNIYSITDYTLLHSLPHEDAGVCYVAWSYDDTKLLTCTREQDNSARVWDVRTGNCMAALIHHFQYPVTAAAWAPDCQSFVIGSQDPEHALSVWKGEGEMVHEWKEDKLRVYDLALSRDGRRLVVLVDVRIIIFNFITREKLVDRTFEGPHIKMTSVSIGQDSRLMLVSMNENRLFLASVETGHILQEFHGHKQKDFMIRSAFGGANENFVISGSEDSNVYIWRTTGQLVAKLDAHRPGCVNAVSWNPKNPWVFATAGDDYKVKIWTNSLQALKDNKDSNGYSLH